MDGLRRLDFKICFGVFFLVIGLLFVVLLVEFGIIVGSDVILIICVVFDCIEVVIFGWINFVIGLVCVNIFGVVVNCLL